MSAKRKSNTSSSSSSSSSSSALSSNSVGSTDSNEEVVQPPSAKRPKKDNPKIVVSVEIRQDETFKLVATVDAMELDDKIGAFRQRIANVANEEEDYKPSKQVTASKVQLFSSDEHYSDKKHKRPLDIDNFQSVKKFVALVPTANVASVGGESRPHNLEAFRVQGAFRRVSDSQDELRPLYVKHESLIREVLDAMLTGVVESGTYRTLSHHFHGYRAVGKTCFLRLLAEALLECGEEVYFMLATKAKEFLSEIEALSATRLKSKQKVFLLLDESQECVAVFTPLLRYCHSIVTIAVGRVSLDTASANLPKKFCFGPDRLLFSRKEFDKDVFYEMSRDCGLSRAQERHFKGVIDLVFQHTRGHGYGTMELAGDFVGLVAQGATAEELKRIFWDSEFISEGKVYKRILERCEFPSSEELKLVDLYVKNMCGLPISADEQRLTVKYCIDDAPVLLKRALLFKYGQENTVKLSDYSFEQLIAYCMSCVQERFRAYDTHGGAIERSIVYELALQLARLGVLDGAPLYEVAPDQGRGRIDLRVNSKFNMFVEALVSEQTEENSKTLQEKLQEHMDRFREDGKYGLVGCSDYRILHVQKKGRVVKKPEGENHSQIFEEKCLTWVVAANQLYLGPKKVVLV